jgi:chromosome transmission fidelity protein 1
VSAGIVVFFTSYQYMHSVIARWKSNGKFEELQSIKPVFIEASNNNITNNHTNSSTGEEVWERYKLSVAHSGRGALLCAVMNGRLSEGINFSDNLARAVVIVGLPYPDPRDLVLQEKLRFYRNSSSNISTNTSVASSTVVQSDLYEALCMKVVNQSVGRAIRHVNDYAAIVLVDCRYSADKVQRLLPAWILRSLQPIRKSYDEMLDELVEFYRERANGSSIDHRF